MVNYSEMDNYGYETDTVGAEWNLANVAGKIIWA
jgi:hypothetical protein